jgi:5'-3' exonuclease
MGFRDIPNVKIVVDYSNVVYRAFHGTTNSTDADKNMINSDGINVGFILGTCKMLGHAINQAAKLGALPKLVLCKDRSPTRKRNLYVKYQEYLKDYTQDKSWDGIDKSQRIRYKGNRIKEELPYNPLQIMDQFLDCIPSEVVNMEGEEADDVIASYIVKHSKENLIVYSTDKDIWQLLVTYPNLKIIIGDNSEPTKESCIKHFDTDDWSKIALHKIIRGDSGDNVKSINRFQFKKNLSAYLNCDGTVEDFIAKVIELNGWEHKDTQKLMDYIMVIKLNYELVQLKKDLDYDINEIKTSDKDKWNELCAIYETPSLFNSPLLNIY